MSYLRPFAVLLVLTALIVLLAMASAAYSQQAPDVQCSEGQCCSADKQVTPQQAQQATVPVAPPLRLFRRNCAPVPKVSISIAGDPRVYRARWGFFGRRIIVRRR